MWAAAEGHADVVQTLIDAGADIRYRLRSGFTPMLFAVREGRTDVVHAFLDAGIDVNETLYRKGDAWMAYDIIIEQVSLVRNYRASFQNIVRDVGIDGLISQLETKVAEASTDEQAQQRLVR